MQRVQTPTAILVAVEARLADACVVALAEGGLRVLKVGHVAAACERIPVVMPQLVLISTAVRADEAEMLADRCVAVGAEVLRLAPESLVDAELQAKLKAAAEAALACYLLRRDT